MTATVQAEALLDWLDFSVTCCLPSCEHAADWWLVCRACNAHFPWCEPHRRREVLDLAAANVFDRARCGRCSETVRVRQWASLFEFIPIGSA